ncbi:hypothetical protein [Paraburkholderia strydomiana]
MTGVNDAARGSSRRDVCACRARAAQLALAAGAPGEATQRVEAPGKEATQ